MRLFSYDKFVGAVALPLALLFAALEAVPAQNFTNPVVTYSTYLGGGNQDSYGETGLGTAVGPDGFVYVVGTTPSTIDFPFTDRLFTNDGGSYQGTFVGKFDPTNRTFLYVTFIPACTGVAVAADASGNAYIAGNCDALFPATNAFQPNIAGGDFDAFVAKLSADGSQLLYATFLGGSSNDLARAIAVDAQGEVIVSGVTDSADFPTTANGVIAPQASAGWETFVSKLDASGKSLLYSTFLGGDGDDMGTGLAVDGSGNIYVSGGTSSTNFHNAPAPVILGTNGSAYAFVAKMSPDFRAVNYLTFIGGKGDSAAAAVAVDANGQAHIFGQTASTNFPVTSKAPQTQFGGGAQDDFVAELSASGSTLIYCSYLGGIYQEDLSQAYYTDIGYLFLPLAGVALDGAGNFYVAGRTRSDSIASGTVSANLHTGDSAGYVAKYDAGGGLVYVRYLGDSLSGTATGLANAGGNLFVTGETDLARLPPYWPTTPGAYQGQYGGCPSDGYFTELTEDASISANDAFTSRQVLSGSRITIQANNTGATAEAGEPAHAGLAASKSLWWSWTAPSKGKLEVATTGSGFDTVLGVYTGNAVAALQNVASNDDESANLTTSRARFPVTAGTAYQIAVDGKGGSGSISLSLTFSAPTNDDFADRGPLSGFPASAAGSDLDGTMESGELAAYYGYYDDRSIWWSWTSPLSGDVAISTAGSDFNTELVIFTGDSLTNLVLLGVNDNETNNVLTSRVTIEAQAGATYQISVRGMDGASGNVRLNIGPTIPPANDDFTNAAVLTGTLSIETNYNADATTEPGEPTLGFATRGGKTLWWAWTAPADGWLRVGTDGSDFDTELGVFTGSVLTNLTKVAANDDEAPGVPQSRVEFRVTSNTVYHIVVDGSQTYPNGKIVLTVFFFQPPVIAASSIGGGLGAPFHFHVTGVEGRQYKVETSTDLKRWTTAPSGLQTDSGAGFDYSDPTAVSGARFYRVQESP